MKMDAQRLKMVICNGAELVEIQFEMLDGTEVNGEGETGMLRAEVI